MKTYYLEDDNDFRGINKWIDELKEGDEGQIYINSNGGMCWYYNVIVDRLNEVNKTIPIILRGIFLASMAFIMFDEYQGKKTIERGCDALIHKNATTLPIFFDNNGIKIRSDEFDKARYKNNTIQLPPRILTKSEVKKFNDGQDIYISYERLKKFYNKDL